MVIEFLAIPAAGAEPLLAADPDPDPEILMQLAVLVMPLQVMLFGVTATISMSLPPARMQLTCPKPICSLCCRRLNLLTMGFLWQAGLEIFLEVSLGLDQVGLRLN